MTYVQQIAYLLHCYHYQDQEERRRKQGEEKKEGSITINMNKTLNDYKTIVDRIISFPSQTHWRTN